MTKPNKQLVELMNSLMGIDEVYEKYAAKSGISSSCFWVLYSAWMRDGIQPCTQRQLSREYYISPQTVNSSLRKMQNQGWVSLAPSLADGREKFVVLTDEGRRVAAELIDPLVEAENRAVSVLPEEEVGTAIRMLNGYRGALLAELSRE